MNLIIRPARAEDKSAVLAFTANVWGGNDYIGEVWDEWLAAGDGMLFVGELAGETVAVSRLASLGPGEGWLQGLRVAETVRRRGVARAMTAHGVALARQRGDRTLRFMTGDDTVAVHRIAEELGFRLAATGTWFMGPPADATPALSLEPLPETALDRLWAEVAGSPALARSSGLYCVRWRYRRLDPDRLREHLRAGEIVSLPSSDAWAILAGGDGLWIGHAQGSEDALVTLLRAAPSLLPRSGEKEIVALCPPDTALARALIAAGYRSDAGGERCYELDFCSNEQS